MNTTTHRSNYEKSNKNIQCPPWAEVKFPLVTRVYGSDQEFNIKVNYHGRKFGDARFRQQLEALQKKNSKEMTTLQQKQEADLQTLCQQNKTIQAQLQQSQADTQQTIPTQSVARKHSSHDTNLMQNTIR